MATPDKGFSPLDPRTWGKIQRPQSQEEREREQHRLRGCGDPGCAMCNPETAGNGFTRRDSMNWVVAGDAVRVPGGFTVSIDFGSGGPDERSPASPSPPRPPSSYTEAREQVEQWLITAPAQSFDDIVGNDQALSQLRDAIRAPVEHKALYEAYGMRMPKGALLSGPPGCGKTMFARAAASEMKALYGEEVEFVSISGSALQSPYVGVTEQRIQSIFAFAREYNDFRGHPLLVFMDEAEVLLPDRTGRVRRVAPWEESQVATFLAEMDGIRESGAFVLLATNRPEVIDQAVLRDGRCDFKIVIRRPTVEALETILQRNFAGVPIAEGHSHADLTFAAIESFTDPHKVILEAHLIGVDLAKEQLVDLKNKHFLFEHLVSGAMAASIPARAKRYAFARDKAEGVVRGVTAGDVVQAVTDLYEENRRLEHSFALEEFKRTFMEEAREQLKNAPPKRPNRKAA